MDSSLWVLLSVFRYMCLICGSPFLLEGVFVFDIWNMDPSTPKVVVGVPFSLTLYL